jgi:hypothetical protein
VRIEALDHASDRAFGELGPVDRVDVVVLDLHEDARELAHHRVGVLVVRCS